MNLTYQSYNKYKIVNNGGKLVIWGYSSSYSYMPMGPYSYYNYNVNEVVFIISDEDPYSPNIIYQNNFTSYGNPT